MSEAVEEGVAAIRPLRLPEPVALLDSTSSLLLVWILDRRLGPLSYPGLEELRDELEAVVVQRKTTQRMGS